jgi:predicted lipoprotein with Yx(FWY)xxD motif
VKKLACALLAVSVLLVVTSLAAFAQDPTVGTNSTAALGTFLTTPTGFTLYTFTGDTPGVSNVSGSLAAVWPPFRASAPLTLPTGVGGTLSTITRSDGTNQVAYNGMPLYTFINDTSAGVVTGQGGAGDRFFVAKAQAAAATATPATAVAAATAVATVAATPTQLPTTGSPGIPLSPAILLAVGVIGVGMFLRRPPLK